ncbi:MAG: transposase, partial [Nitrospirae bacterium]|nr:transposase [Nitrospirota bacterium]
MYKHYVYDNKDGAFVDVLSATIVFTRNSSGLRSEIINHLKRYENSEDKVVRSLCRKLLKRQDHLFTFIFHEGVEPTNNVSERSLRGPVQWRKICFGNRSDAGA